MIQIILYQKNIFQKKLHNDHESQGRIEKTQGIENNIATQIFTKNGPIAFLPISNSATSVVFSLDTKSKKYNDSEVLDLINENKQSKDM